MIANLQLFLNPLENMAKIILEERFNEQLQQIYRLAFTQILCAIASAFDVQRKCSSRPRAEHGFLRIINGRSKHDKMMRKIKEKIESCWEFNEDSSVIMNFCMITGSFQKKCWLITKTPTRLRVLVAVKFQILEKI